MPTEKQNQNVSYLDRELNKLERQRKDLRDNYNTLEPPYDGDEYEKNPKISHHPFSPKNGQTLHDYYIQLTVNDKIVHDKNYKAHINGPKGHWYMHVNPMGCWGCEEAELSGVQLNVIAVLAHKYPDFTF